FGNARAGKPAIEQIALNAGGGEHGIDPEGDAAHRIRKPDLLELVADQADPGALIGIGARRMELMLDRTSPVEREDEHEPASAPSQLSKRSSYAARQPVDYEEEPLGVAKDIIGPLERGMRKRWGRRAKEQPAIVGPREPPQSHAGGTETKLDRGLIEQCQLAAGFDPGSFEQVCQIGL